MNNLTARLRLLREAFAADREGQAEYRRLERELAEHADPADRLDIEATLSPVQCCPPAPSGTSWTVCAT